MSSRFLVLIAIAMLALPLCATGARGDSATSPPAQTAAAEDDKDAADMKEAPDVKDAPKDPAATKKYSANVCEITGVVARLENVERSPWSDGTPSTLSIFETDIWVTVNDRKPHFKNAPADSICNRGAKGEVAVYKLCPVIKVNKGDRIRGVEGLHTGSAKAAGCLFDLVVLPPDTAKKKT